MSELLDIVNRITSMQVSADGMLPHVWPLGRSRNSIETAHLPLRLVLPIGSSGGGTDFQYDNALTGRPNRATLNWQYQELFLLRAKGRGLGVADAWLILTKFLADYADKLVGLYRPRADSKVTGWSYATPQIEYPQNSGKWFYGALITVEIEETICPSQCQQCKKNKPCGCITTRAKGE